MPGHSVQDADATGAYTQSPMTGTKTYVILPRERWPESWKKFQQPVALLRIALEGHPKAGMYWEDHCRKSIQKCGFEPVPGWECMYMNKSLKLFLNVYVDDFKLSGRTLSMPIAWKNLKQYLDLDEPTEYNTYLGCSVHPIGLDPSMARTRSEAFLLK